MVWMFDGFVYRALVTPKVGTDKDMVYPKIESVFVIRDAESASRLGKCVMQSVGYYTMGVWERWGVEVAAYNDRRSRSVSDNSCYGIGLGRPDGYGIRQLAYQSFRTLFYFVRLRFFYHFHVRGTVVQSQFIRFQVIVDNGERIVFYFQYVDHASVGFALVIDRGSW